MPWKNLPRSDQTVKCPRCSKVPKPRLLGQRCNPVQTRKRQQKRRYSLLLNGKPSLSIPEPQGDDRTLILRPFLGGFCYQIRAGLGRGQGGGANLWWHVAVHLLRFLHLLRSVTLRGWVFIFLLQSCGGPALGRACVHGRKVPRRAGAVGSIIQISFKVNAHSWGGHIAFNDIPLILWSTTRNKV